ncbi:MAG: TrbG/VirB9 family P-type conjugative transfer protein [Acidobacteriota bacterium]
MRPTLMTLCLTSLLILAGPGFHAGAPAPGGSPCPKPSRLAIQDASSSPVQKPSAQSQPLMAETVVVDPHHPQEFPPVYQEAAGVQSVQDDPAAPKVYLLPAAVDHCTVIQVPDTVAKAWCGDLQGWTLDGQGSYVSVKPLAENLSTNLHVLTASGRLYNFRLVSIGEGGSYVDLFQIHGSGGYQANLDDLVSEKVREAKKAWEAQEQKQLAETLDRARFDWTRQYAEKTLFDYRVDQARAFHVEGVFSDGTFTYFRVQGDEKPIIFLETRHGWHRTRELLNWAVTGGDFYRVQKILEPGQRFILKLRDQEAVIERRGA